MCFNQEERQDIINSLISEWEHMMSTFTREELEEDCSNSGMDVILQRLEEDELQLHIGDARYDDTTNPLSYWGEAALEYDWDEDVLNPDVTELVDNLVEQVEKQ